MVKYRSLDGGKTVKYRTLTFPHPVYIFPRLLLQLVVGAAQVGEEVVTENLGELHQRVRVNPLAGENEIDVVAVAAQLLRKPRGLDAFLCYYLLDEFAYVWIPFLHVPVRFLLFGATHKKSVELIPCLNIRVSTPYSSNKLFHAVSLRHW
jgi:hypothetical protein